MRYVPTGSFMLSHQTPNLGMRDSTPVETSAKRCVVLISGVVFSLVKHRPSALVMQAAGIVSQQFSPPDRLLLGAFESSLAQAALVEASTVCIPALGIGVKGWRPAISAALGVRPAIK